MSQSLFLALAMWGMTFYVLRHTRKIEATNRVLRGLPSSAPASWIGKLLYVVIGLSVASAVFVGSALADGADPFGHFQRVFQSPIKITPVPLSATTPTLMPSVTPTAIPSSTLWITPTLPANTPVLAIPTPENGQGWEKTPNGQGQGQFQTPPGQGGVPPGQEKKTQEPKPTNEPKPNNGSGKK